MTTLSQITTFTRKFFLWIAIAVGSLILIAILIQVYAALRQTFFPPPPTPPTVRFGKLPQIVFPIQAPSQAFSYTLTTLTGSLPNLGNQATVYKLFVPQPNLVAFDTATQLLAHNGFTNMPTQVSDTKFSWKSNDPLSPTITYDILTDDFFYTTTFLNNPSIQNATQLPNTTGAIDVAKSFFLSYEPLPDTLDLDKTQTSLFSINNTSLTPTASLSDTKIIRVDFFLKDINTLHMYTPNYPYSFFYALVGGGVQQPQVVEASFIRKTVLTDFFATYPIKTTQAAFDQLQKGNAYIANYSGNSNTIIIRDVTLGYYIGKDPQTYAMPIIVFHGDNNFYAYVPAVTDEWLDK